MSVHRCPPMTRYKLSVLSTLNHRSGTARDLGDHPSHFERACREMEQAGLVAKNLHDEWRLQTAGQETLEEAGW